MTKEQRNVVEALRDQLARYATQWPSPQYEMAKKDRERADALTAILDATRDDINPRAY
jgi:hypothetical protein